MGGVKEKGKGIWRGEREGDMGGGEGEGDMERREGRGYGWRRGGRSGVGGMGGVWEERWGRTSKKGKGRR